MCLIKIKLKAKIATSMDKISVNDENKLSNNIIYIYKIYMKKNAKILTRKKKKI